MTRPVVDPSPAAAPPLGAAPGPPSGAHPGRGTRVAATMVLTAVVAVLVGGGSADFVLRTQPAPAPTQVIVRTATPSGQTKSTTVPGVVAADQRSLVQVVRQPARGAATPADVATGFVADASGLVVTDEAAVSGASGLAVVLPNGARTTATLAAADPDTGIVVLRIAVAGGLHALQFGQAPRVGEAAIALTQPVGAGPAVDLGTVSATGLVVRVPNPAGAGSPVALGGALRTDAPVPAGGAGGPLVDADGRVIGVLAGPGVVTAAGVALAAGSAIALDAAAAEGLVSALTSATLVPTAPGVVSEPLDPASAASLGLPAGALVVTTRPGSPVAVAGLRPGDVVEAVDGRGAASLPSVSDYLVQQAVNEPERLTVWRLGVVRHLVVVLPPDG
ncbi:MAG TPA: S1C family serine protease [Candidatus Micrarchaeia archaeon]|nr:S1C family serine protease [Candidatus Micrarchaeia archaeon]